MSRTEPAGLRSMVMALWFGLLMGLAEVAALTLSKPLFQHHYWFFGPELVWVTPLADMILFTGIGLGLTILGRIAPRIFTARVVAFVYAFVATTGLLFMIDGLGHYAALVLAAGLAVQVSAMVTRHPWSRYALARRLRGARQSRPTTARPEADREPPADSTVTRRELVASAGTAALTIAALAGGTQGWQGLTEARSRARLPSSKPHAPNVLLIVMDTVRAASVSLVGYQRQTTPRLASFAAKGTLFTRAISTAPWTLPSHSSVFTGHYSHQLSSDWTTPLDATYPTLAEAFGAEGYLTAGFVGNLQYASREWGLNRGFTHYEAIPSWPGALLVDSSLGRALDYSATLHRLTNYDDDIGRKHAPNVTEGFLSWLSGRDSRRPFFAFLNYFDAHRPYVPPAPFQTRFSRTTQTLPRAEVWVPRSQSEVQAELDAYESCIAYIDNELGALLSALENQDLLGETLVIVMADHGEEFDEHGVLEHGGSTYLRSIHVPLLLSYPSRVPSGSVIRTPVTLRDLAATMANLAGLKGAGMFPGSTLARFWDSAASPTDRPPSPLLSELNPAAWAIRDGWGPVSKGPMKSLVFDQYHYIRNGDGREELYDFEQDPVEARDLSHNDDAALLLREFRTGLEAALDKRRIP